MTRSVTRRCAWRALAPTAQAQSHAFRIRSVPPSNAFLRTVLAAAAATACVTATDTAGPTLSVADVTTVPDSGASWRFTAHVTDSDTDQPLAGAEIRIADDPLDAEDPLDFSRPLPCAPTLSRSNGRADNVCHGSGTHRVIVVAVGYAPIEGTLDPAPGHRYELRVQLRPVSLPDSISVPTVQEPLRQ